MSAADDYPLHDGPSASVDLVEITETTYGAAMAEIDRLRTENAELRNTDELIRLLRANNNDRAVAEYVQIKAERDELRTALVRWDRGQLSAGWGRVDEELASLIPEDCWGLDP